MKIALVISEFAEKSGNTISRLRETCVTRLEELEIENPEIFSVPGAFEIPVVVKKILETKKYSAVITLGAVVRGETAHFDFVAGNCARKLADLSVEFGVPVIFGVLTTDTTTQAEARGERGAEFAECAIQMVQLLKEIKKTS